VVQLCGPLGVWGCCESLALRKLWVQVMMGGQTWRIESEAWSWRGHRLGTGVSERPERSGYSRVMMTTIA
jgi:hypothetical protein